MKNEATENKNLPLNSEHNSLAACQGEAFRAGRKLQAWGVLLQRQSEDGEGFAELEGLGMALSDLGGELETLAHQLDSIHFKDSKLRALSPIAE